MASEAKVILGCERTSDGLKSMDETRTLVFLEDGIDDLGYLRLADHPVILADITMRAEVEAERATTHPAISRG